MQRVTEFVEHRRRVVPGNQHRLARFAFHEVRVVGNDGGDFAIEALLGAIGIHPRARTFALTGKRIEVPEADVLAGGFVSDFPNFDVRMGDRNIVPA